MEFIANLKYENRPKQVEQFCAVGALGKKNLYTSYCNRKMLLEVQNRVILIIFARILYTNFTSSSCQTSSTCLHNAHGNLIAKLQRKQGRKSLFVSKARQRWLRVIGSIL